MPSARLRKRCEIMPTPHTPGPDEQAPWATKRGPGGRHIVRASLPWLFGALLLSLVAWGLWPKPILVETGLVTRSPLTVRVSEEGKTRIRNRYVVAAPVAGKMRRVPLKAGDTVVVTSKDVPQPVGVQYAYCATPMNSNLYNKAGLPATPFAVFEGKPLFEEDDPAKVAAVMRRGGVVARDSVGARLWPTP